MQVGFICFILVFSTLCAKKCPFLVVVDLTCFLAGLRWSFLLIGWFRHFGFILQDLSHFQTSVILVSLRKCRFYKYFESDFIFICSVFILNLVKCLIMFINYKYFIFILFFNSIQMRNVALMTNFMLV